jgi:hypothetical protein
MHIAAHTHSPVEVSVVAKKFFYKPLARAALLTFLLLAVLILLLRLNPHGFYGVSDRPTPFAASTPPTTVLFTTPAAAAATAPRHDLFTLTYLVFLAPPPPRSGPAPTPLHVPYA